VVNLTVLTLALHVHEGYLQFGPSDLEMRGCRFFLQPHCC